MITIKSEVSKFSGAQQGNIEFLLNDKLTTVGFFEIPTHNCQISSLGGFANLLYKFNDNECITLLKELRKEANMLQQKYLQPLRNQLLIDVKNDEHNYPSRVRKLFKNIVFEQNYVSTNESQMTMFLVKFKDYGD